MAMSFERTLIFEGKIFKERFVDIQHRLRDRRGFGHSEERDGVGKDGYIYIYIYIYRERERERDRKKERERDRARGREILRGEQ